MLATLLRPLLEAAAEIASLGVFVTMVGMLALIATGS